jgi:outer membrane protein assembly factor BamB
VRVFSAASHAAASSGTQLWVKRYDGPTGSINQANAVAVSPTGNEVFVTGYSQTVATGPDYATIAYNATTGAQLWVKRYKSPAFGSPDYATSVAVSPSGGAVYVTGQSGTGGYATIAYNATTGAQLWVKIYRPGTVAYSVAVSPSGGAVFVTGQDTGLDYATVAYDATTGTQLWAKRYISPAAGAQANSLAVSPSGKTVFVTGYSSGATSGEDYATVAYNAATGAQLWAKRYNGPANGTDVAHSVAVSSTGNAVFVTGESYATASEEDYATVAYNAATGAQLWVKLYGAPGSDNQARSVAVSPGGGTVFVTGVLNLEEGYATIAYNAATGTQLWVKTYTTSGGAYSVAISPSGGTVYVTGEGSTPTTGPDYATVAYNAATGAQLWAKRYQGPASDQPNSAYAMAVSPTSGTVFVTGQSYGTTNLDYATVAYTG